MGNCNPPVIYHDYMFRWREPDPKHFWVWLLIAIGALVVLMASACLSPASPTSSDPPPDVEKWWSWGAADVACYVSRPPSWDEFAFVRMPGAFDCGGVKGTAGCFRPGKLDRRFKGTIYWAETDAYVVRHEAAHAILWARGEPCWHTIGHEKGCAVCR